MLETSVEVHLKLLHLKLSNWNVVLLPYYFTHNMGREDNVPIVSSCVETY